MYAFPTVLFAIVILATLGQSLINIFVAIGFTFWPSMARLVRSQVLSLREKEYVEAARAIGVPSWRIMFLQILPNALGPIIVAVTFGIPFAILIEAFLSFIGIGTPVPVPSWGGMISDARGALRTEPYLVFFPAAALAITLFAFNFFGDGLRDALDPRSRR
jgi:oligopeptide transport system permease protein